MKPYGLIIPIRCKADLEVDYVKRLKFTICKDDLNPDDFEFCQYGYIPNHLRDSFSNQFVGEKIILTIATKK